MTDLKFLGELQLGKKVICTDPCYELGIDGTYIFNNVKDGVWRGYVTYDNDERVSTLIASHEDFPIKNINNMGFIPVPQRLYVDSGQMTICNLKDYSFCDSEYDKYCRITLSRESAGLVGEYTSINPYETSDFSLKRAYAVVSASGWGDGAYSLYMHQDKDERVIAILIRF